MSTGSDAEWILSRKIAVKSLARHFAPWKKRFFVLDRANGLLGVRSSNDTMVVINLYSPDFLVLRHEYSVDDKNSITIKYREEDSSTVKEIVMKFENTEQLDYWEKALHSAAEDVKAVTATSTRALFHSFIDYINEQSQVRKIIDSESQYEAQYYAEGEMESEYTGFMASSMVSEAEREQFIAEHSRYLDNSHSPPVPASVTTGVDEEVAAKIRIKPLSIPRMRILLVAVGTRGDMQPFVQLGLRLQRDGHRVRLATHACFRDYVQGKGLEFYPLAGDPLKLSEFMVKTQGFVIPTTPELLMQAPIYHAMVVDMMYSCWGACVDPDPADPEQKKFVADAIISNPVSYAHVHCAEALGIPLHLMFPQPWTPTKAFPHPLSCLSYQQGWSAENYISYQLVDSMLWMSFERQINAFRTTILGLEPLRVGNGGWNHLNTMKVPFVKMWSPSFVPKPKDWPSYVDVVGTFFDTAAPAPAVVAPANSSAETSATIGKDKKRRNKHSESHEEDVHDAHEDTTVHTHVAVTSSTRTRTAPGTEKKPNQGTITTKTVHSDVSVTATTTAQAPSTVAPSTAPTAAPQGPPMSPIVESSFTPPPALLNFLESGDAPVFVGFGSMVVKDLEALISLFLEGAALAGVRVIVQVGWSEITPERFLDLALQAQLKASIVREAESMNDNLLSSVIFPSARQANQQQFKQNAQAAKSVTSGVADLSLSCRSVESVEDDNHDTHDHHDERDESTLDGERLFSVSTRESESALAVSSISASGGHSGLRDAYNNGTLVDAEFDTSPIPSPPRTVSTDGGHRSSESNMSGSLSGSTGLGNWLLGAAMNLSKTFSQPSTSVKGNSTPSSDSNHNNHHNNHNQKPPSRSAPHHAKHATHSAPHHHNHNNNYNNKHDHNAETEDPLAQSDISACWDEVERDHTWSASKDAMFLGPCPHDWLFQRVAGVVHHGGAGTTAAGLRYGCPSWICPFFGDQHFWGEMVHRRKVGPKPCPIGALTLPIVAESLALLLDDETIAHAAALAAQMATEDGVEGACQAFYKHLPVENMICDVSLFRGEYRLAQVYCQDCGFKMCNEVAQFLHSEPSLHLQQHILLPCCYKDWSRPPPASAAEGLIQGLGGLVHEIKEGVSDILYDPVHGIYQQGLSGAAAGLSSGLNSLLSRPLAGGSVLLNKVKAGIQASLAANLHYGVEPSAYDPLNADSSCAIVGAKHSAHSKSHGADDSAPLVLNDLQANRIRALKMSLPDMPAVYSPKLPHKTLHPLESHVEDVKTSPQTSVPILAESPVRLKQAEQDKKSSPTAPTSPRGATTVLDSRTPSPLHVSVLRSASLDSSTFYGAPRDVDGAEVDSDGDDSVYDAEADEAMPFVLDQPATTASSSSRVDLEKSSSRLDVDPSDTPCPPQPLEVTRNSSRNSGVHDSLSSTVNHSNDDSIHANSPLPAETPVPSSPGPLAPSPRPVPAKSAVVTDAQQSALKKEQNVDVDKTELTLLEAFRVAQDTQHLFTSLGAENGRFLPTKEFGKLMQRAVLRETAVRSIDTLATDTDIVVPQKQGSLSAHVTGQHHAKVGRDGTPVLNETSINALMQMVAHNKRYMDFVDFSLIYLQLAEADHLV